MVTVPPGTRPGSLILLEVHPGPDLLLLFRPYTGSLIA